jgi:hypothetical protein
VKNFAGVAVSDERNIECSIRASHA